MNVIKKIEQDIKDYVRSLNTPDNEVYKNNELLILSCFSKCLEIIERYDSNTGIVRGGAIKVPPVHREVITTGNQFIQPSPTTPTEPLPAEGSAKSVRGGFYCTDDVCLVQCDWCKEQERR